MIDLNFKAVQKLNEYLLNKNVFNVAVGDDERQVVLRSVEEVYHFLRHMARKNRPAKGNTITLAIWGKNDTGFAPYNMPLKVMIRAKGLDDPRRRREYFLG
jgi:hypothetical protein